MGREWQWGGGQREEEMEKGAVGKRGEDGKGEKKGQEEGRFHRWI